MRTLTLTIFLLISGILDSYILGNDAPSPSRPASFVVHSFDDGPSPSVILERCENLHTQFRHQWLPKSAEASLQPPCEVVLHADRVSYLRAIGRRASASQGSSLISFDRGRVASRRIDVIVDDEGATPALAHEIVHVILADQFGGKQPPRWIDEGIATMADAVDKQLLHERDCRQSLIDGTALTLRQLMTLSQFRTSGQMAPFYGQSLSLVRYLAAQDEPHRLIPFANTALRHGYDHALRHHYRIDGVAALEREWRRGAARIRRQSIAAESLAENESLSEPDVRID